jgi:hypothetical protein
MRKWLGLIFNFGAFTAGMFLVTSYWHSGNHDASWGWGVASIYVFVELGKSIVEVFYART